MNLKKWLPEISIFPDRIAIVNPGPFANEFEPIDFVERDIQECLLDAGMIKIHKRGDTWQISNCKKSLINLFEQLKTPMVV